jgi:murein DD-endopeptidase MepM/ murein hydrolase activator NlpD
MNSAVELLRAWPHPRAIALVLTAIAATGCSPDSTRFADNAYGPRSAQADVTGSVASGPAAPAGRVETKPLPQTSQVASAQSAAVAEPSASPAAVGGGRGSPPPSSYAPTSSTPSPTPHSTPASAAPSLETTGSNKSAGRNASAPASQWNWDGGTAITVAPGETLEAIARRHGVPVSAILEANNLASPHAIQAGQRLVIPRYNAHAAEAPAPSSHVAVAMPKSVPQAPATAAPALPAPAAPAASNAGVHVVAAGDTLTKIAHRYRKSVAEIVKANNITPAAKLNIGDRILIPGTRVSAAQPEPNAAVAKPALASVGPVQNVTMVTPVPEATATEATPKVAAEANPGFRWPVHGRVIAGFGAKPNGQQNDGIDVAVPENTPVKAAEDGVVAYAGNELKGYGNLVLVRHANGYVTAYAHAKELLVKRGDQIKRGQIIAKSGQSGNADSPQLHFEVRKGSAPVDPMQFLSGT